MAREADFDLVAALARPGFTPAQRDAPALVALVVEGAEPGAPRAAAALARLGATGLSAIATRLDTGGPRPAAAGRAGRRDDASEPPAGGRGEAAPRAGLDDAAAGRPGRRDDASEPPAGGRGVAAGPTGRPDDASEPPAGGRGVAAPRAGLDDAAIARLIAVVGAIARDPATDEASRSAARERVIAAARSEGARARRAAVIALGKLGGDEARAALIARWDAGDAAPDERRALAEALGKLGGDEVLARLRAVDPGADAELARRRDRAVLMADRSARRDEDSQVVTDQPAPAPVRVRLACRPGLAGLLAEEIAALRMRATARGDAAVELELGGPWSALFASRLWAHAAIRIPFERPPGGSPPRADRPGDRADRVADPEALAAAITRAVTAPATRALLQAWTRGPIRWRLGFAHGHKRAIVWRVARDVAAAAPELINDPTATTWDVVDDEDGGGDGGATLALVPRRLVDPRFAWRVAEVPAASHPSVAAALAWIAEPGPGDRVWDPFCGAGSELIERARRGPCRALLGTDLDERALEAARANLAAAGITAELARADARDHAPPAAIDLVITNPPLGSRVQLDAPRLLADALPNLVRRLAPGGRLVWITPAPRRTAPIAQQLGLRLTRAVPVDLGGVRGQLERWDAGRARG